jgi:hypothetical protein
MFETMMARAEAAALKRVRMRIEALTERLRSELPSGIGATSGPEGVSLFGRALRLRLALEPKLRWTIGDRVDG